MNLATVIVGVLFLCYGLLMVIVRRLSVSGSWKKLEPLRERFTTFKGTMIHIVFYESIPIACGIIIIYYGYRGLSLF